MCKEQKLFINKYVYNIKFLYFFIYIYFFKDHFWTFPQGNIGSKNIVGSEDGVKVSGKEIIYLVVVGLLNN